VLILQNQNLNIDGVDIVFLSIIEELRLQWNCIPTGGLLELEVLHFLEVLHVVAGSDGKLGRRVGLIGLEVKKHAELLYPCLLHELDVDEMRLRAIGLPKGIGIVVTKLLHSVSHLCRGEGPNRLSAYLSSRLVVDGRGRVVNVG
jgi:hypothetical protein